MLSIVRFVIALAIFLTYIAPWLIAALIVYVEHQGGQ